MYKAFEQLEMRDLVTIALREKEPTAMDGLFKQYPSLPALTTITVEEIQSLTGLAEDKALQLRAIIELARRYATYQAPKPKIIRGPEDVATLLADMAYLDREVFAVVLLNTKHRILGVERVAIGGLSSCPVHPREVFKSAIKRSAFAVILAHNHPSGDPEPSSDDMRITQRFVTAGKLLGISVLDHVVIGQSGYVSINARGGIQ